MPINQKLKLIGQHYFERRKKYGDAFNTRLFLEQLVYFKDVVGSELKFLKQKVTASVLEKFFQDEIKKIKL